MQQKNTSRRRRTRLEAALFLRRGGRFRLRVVFFDGSQGLALLFLLFFLLLIRGGGEDHSAHLGLQILQHAFTGLAGLLLRFANCRDGQQPLAVLLIEERQNVFARFMAVQVGLDLVRFGRADRYGLDHCGLGACFQQEGIQSLAEHPFKTLFALRQDDDTPPAPNQGEALVHSLRTGERLCALWQAGAFQDTPVALAVDPAAVFLHRLAGLGSLLQAQPQAGSDQGLGIKRVRTVQNNGDGVFIDGLLQGIQKILRLLYGGLRFPVQLQKIPLGAGTGRRADEAVRRIVAAHGN